MKLIFKPIKKITKKILGKKNNNLINVISLCGVIGKDSKIDSGINFNNCYTIIKKAFEHSEVKAVAISVNSPGGSPVQSELIYNFIREMSEAKKIPVYTFAQDLSASGGYWLLLAGDEIYAHNSSIVGSIGVIFSSFGLVEVIKKLGIERRIYTEGKNKAILDPFLPEVEENISILKSVQKDIYQHFVELVKSRRQNKLKVNDEQIFTGAFWSGKTAKELGLIDEIADLRAKMQEKFGNDVEFNYISPKKSFLKNFFSEKTNIASKIVYELEEKISFNKFGL